MLLREFRNTLWKGGGMGRFRDGIPSFQRFRRRGALGIKSLETEGGGVSKLNRAQHLQ